ncbi:hypothetical protein WDW89_06015 [Deltaproteobacteria bacterium TL4]
MLVSVNIILILIVIALAVFFHKYVSQTSEYAKELEKDFQELRKRMKLEDKDVPLLPPRKLELRLVIEILDPIAVAKNHHIAAHLVSGLAPAMITKEVYRQAQKESIRLMEERGVDAKVRITTV